MVKSKIFQGKTRQEAIDKGLKELKVSKNMVTITDIEEGKRSFYSILSPRVVKVEITVKEDAEKSEKPEKQTKTSGKPKRERRKFNENIQELEFAKTEIEKFLNKLLGKEIKPDVQIKDFKIEVVIEGENLNYLIGYRGEAINSLQNILTMIANKKAGDKIRVLLDIAGYKNKREKTLEELAEKIAKTVIRTKKSVALEPMTAFERRIIHSKLQDNDKIITFSKGEEPYRKIVVGLKK